MRVFLDTNVLASGLGTRGLCAELVESVISGHELLTCKPVLVELESVLAEKFHLPESSIKAFLGLLKTHGRVVESKGTPAIRLKDSADIAILACAIAAKAEVFVTGDKALLELQEVEGIPILSPRQLWLRLTGLEDQNKPD